VQILRVGSWKVQTKFRGSRIAIRGANGVERPRVAGDKVVDEDRERGGTDVARGRVDLVVAEIDSESTSPLNAALLREGDVAELSVVITDLSDTCLRVVLNLRS